MIKLSTHTNRPPISVTAQSGILSKNPQSSIAVTISVGSMVVVAVPNPAEFMMVLMTPCMTLRKAIINSRP